MTKQDLIHFEPVFTAIKQGRNVQIFTNELYYHTRGWWKSTDNWGFGGSTKADFRIKNPNGTIEYFDEKSKNRNQNDLDEPEIWCPNYENYLN